MTSFFWSSGHIGWGFFGIIVFSVLCLLATDTVWCVIPTSARKLFAVAAMVWAVGAAALITCWYVWTLGAA